MIEIIIVMATILVVIFCTSLGSEYSMTKFLLCFAISLSYIIYWGYRKEDIASLILSIFFLISTIFFGFQTVLKKKN